jgi:tetratricopeptide (TPR) repeat protein
MMKCKLLICGLLCLLSLSAKAQTYDELFEKASHYEATDSLDSAVQMYKRAIEKNPTNIRNSMLFANIARDQRRMNKNQEALQSYGFALNLLPLSVPILLDRASLYAELFDDDHAIIDCNTVLDVQKDNKEALTLRSFLYYKSRRYQEAQADYAYLLLLDSKDLGARIGMATLYEAQEKYRQSLEVLNSLIIDRPGDPDIYMMRANVDKDLILYDYALMDVEKAIEVARKPTAEMWIFKGDILLHQKKKYQARECYETAIKLGTLRSALMERLRKSK